MIQTLKILLACIFICIGLSTSAQSSHYKFIENKGQYPSNVLFSVELENGTVFFESDRFTYKIWDAQDLNRISSYHGAPPTSELNTSVKGHVYQVIFENSDVEELKPENTIRGTTNFFLGNDQSKWASNCRSFSGIWYKNLYPGIDLHVYSNDFLLKYDYVVKKGADPTAIKQLYEGVDKMKLKNGSLEINTSAGLLKELAPVSYQRVQGENILVNSNYVKKGNQISYGFPKGYNKQNELIIDPELIFSTYSGSTSDNFGYTATFDNQGFLYSGSSAFGNGYPTTLGAFQENWGGGTVDIALSKIDTTGTFLIWSTYVGGNDDELVHSIMVNEENELYLLGTSSSENYPTTDNTYDNTYNGGENLPLAGLGVIYENGSDIILTRLSEDGSQLLGSTYVGGSLNDGLNYNSALKYNYADEIRGEIQLDENGNVFVVSSTYSTDFPVSNNAFQTSSAGGLEAVAFMMSPDLANLEWSTYVGGESNDAGYSLTLDQGGDVLICGGTQSVTFPITPNAFQDVFTGGLADGYFCKISNNGQELVYATYYGSDQYDQLYFTETDATDNLYVFGQTEHAGSEFIFNADYNTIGGGQILSKFTPDLETLEWSTAFGTGGGQPNISPTAFLVDVCDRIYLSGWGGPTGNGGLGVSGMDVTADAYKSTSISGDFYLMVIFDDASDIFYGTYFGGDQSNEHVDGGTSRFNRKGQVYQAVCAGCGSNDDFPIEPLGQALSPTNNSTNCNLGVFKFDFQIPITIADFIVPNQICTNQEFTINNQSIFSDSFTWNFGDGTPLVNSSNPTHTYSSPGIYEITLSVSSELTCNGTDEITREVVIQNNNFTMNEEAAVCSGDQVQLGVENNPDYSYIWTPSSSLSDSNISNPTAFPLVDTEYILSIQRGACTDTLIENVTVENLDFTISEDVFLCDEEEVVLEVFALQNVEVTWSSQSDFSTMENDNLADYDISVLATESTTYYAQVAGELCVEEEEVSIIILPATIDLIEDLNICLGDTVSLAVLNPAEGVEYNWTPVSEVLSGNGTGTVLVAPSELTLFTVSAEFEDCVLEAQIEVEVEDISGAEFTAIATPPTIIEGGESQLLASNTDLSYTWTPSSSLSNSSIYNPIATPNETTTYMVTGSLNGCSVTVPVKVSVVDFICGAPLVFIPNAFSPNGDGENDELLVYGQNLTKVHLAVFNRWGEKVFETFDQEIGWDGIYNNKPSAPAVFDYYLEVTCEGGFDYFEKGNVTLIR